MTPLVRDRPGMSPPIFIDAKKNVEVKFGLDKIIIGPVDIDKYTLEELRARIYADFGHAIEENAHLLITYKRSDKENILVARQQCLYFAFKGENNPIIFNVTLKSKNGCDSDGENLCVSPGPSNELNNCVERLQTQSQPPTGTPSDKIEAPPLQDPNPNYALDKRFVALEKDTRDEVAALKDEWTQHQFKIQTLLDAINECLSKMDQSNASPASAPVPSKAPTSTTTKTANATSSTSTSCITSTGNTGHAPQSKSKSKSTWFSKYLDELHGMGRSHTMPFTHPHQILYPAGNFWGQHFMPQFTPPIPAPAPAPVPASGPMVSSSNGPLNFHQMAHPAPLATNFGAGYNNFAYYGFPQMAPPTPAPALTPMTTASNSNFSGHYFDGPPSLPGNQYTVPQGNYTGQQLMPPPLTPAPSPATRPGGLVSASAAVGSQPTCSPMQTQQKFSHSTVAPPAPPTINVAETVGKCNGSPQYTSPHGFAPIPTSQIQDGRLGNGDAYNSIYPSSDSL